LFPTFLQNAKPLGIQVYEIYPDDYQAAYHPPADVTPKLSAAIAGVLQAVSTPLSCGVNPLWYSY
jgi:hypothetical protein